MESRRLVIKLTLLSLTRPPRMYMVLFVITFPMLLLILMGMASFVSVGSERHVRIPVYIFLSKFIFVESYHCSQNWRISVSSGEVLVFPGERQSSGNL